MSLLDDLLGRSAADASNQAAQDTFRKQQAAAEASRVAGANYNSGMQSIATNYDPYTSAGNSALQRLLAGLGLGGGGEDFTAAYRALPGYQAGLDTGTDAALRAGNAGGTLASGRTLKQLQRFGSDYEDQRSGSYLDRLYAASGMGLQATGAKTGVQSQGLGGELQGDLAGANQQFGAAGTIGQGMVAGEQAKQTALGNLLTTAGYLGGAALGGPIGGQLGSLWRATPSSFATGGRGFATPTQRY